jgi:hypothetical protein
MFCRICKEETEYESDLCDFCWYGMRLNPEEWIASLKERGIEAPEKTGGCNLADGTVFCTNPY